MGVCAAHVHLHLMVSARVSDGVIYVVGANANVEAHAVNSFLAELERVFLSRHRNDVNTVARPYELHDFGACDDNGDDDDDNDDLMEMHIT